MGKWWKARNTHSIPRYECSGWFKPFQVFCLQRFALFCLPALPHIPVPAPNSVLPSSSTAVIICEAWGELWQGRDVIKPRREEMSAAMQTSSWHSTFKRFQKLHSDDFRLGRPVSLDGRHALLWCCRQLRSLSAGCCAHAYTVPSPHTQLHIIIFMPLQDRYPWMPLEASNFHCKRKL